MPGSTPKDLRESLAKTGLSSLVTSVLTEGLQPVEKAIKRPKITRRFVEENFAELMDWKRLWDRANIPRADLVYDAGTNAGLMGRVSLPKKVVFEDQLAVAAILGEADTVQRASDRFERLKSFDPRLKILARTHPFFCDISDTEFDTVMRYLDWRRSHPDERCGLRSIHVEGMDTKFIERHEKLIRQASAALELVDHTHPPDDLRAYLKFETVDARTIEVCLPLSERGPALSSGVIKVPPANLKVDRFERIVVFENHENFLEVEPTDGTLSVFGQGYAAASIIESLGIPNETPVYYFGDLDSHGFNILRCVREARPSTRSLMMNVETVEENWNRGVTEPENSRCHVYLYWLQDPEIAALELLQRHTHRIEQQFIQDRLSVLSDAGLHRDDLVGDQMDAATLNYTEDTSTSEQSLIQRTCSHLTNAWMSWAAPDPQEELAPRNPRVRANRD